MAFEDDDSTAIYAQKRNAAVAAEEAETVAAAERESESVNLVDEIFAAQQARGNVDESLTPNDGMASVETSEGEQINLPQDANTTSINAPQPRFNVDESLTLNDGYADDNSPPTDQPRFDVDESQTVNDGYADDENPPELATPELAPVENDYGITATVWDMTKGVLRAPIAETADILDNIDGLLEDTAGFDLIPLNNSDGSRSTLRDFVDNNLGQPDTVPGQLAQDIAGQLVLMIPAARAIKGASWLARGTRVIAVPALVAGATSGVSDGNVSTLATTYGEGTIFDNDLTRALAVDTDDSTFERMAKTAVEDVAMGAVFEGATTIFKHRASIFKHVRKLRALRKAGDAISTAAIRSGVPVDSAVANSVDDLVQVQAGADMLDDAVDHLDELVENAEVRSEAAAFAGEAADPSKVSPEASLQILKKAKQGAVIEREAQQTLIAQAEAKVLKSAETSLIDGRGTEAIRQSLRKEGFSSDQIDQALGDAATRNMPVAPELPKRQMFDNGLEVDQATATRIGHAARMGDDEDFTDGFAAAMDNTNYNHIETEGGLENLMRDVAEQGSALEKSTRVGPITHETTDDAAEAALAAMAMESGATPESIVTNVMAMLPEANSITQAVQVARRTNVIVHKKMRDVARSMNLGEITDVQRAELGRWAVMSANISDRLSGVVGDAARSTSAMRIDIITGSPDDVLAGGAGIRGEQLTDVLEQLGGRDHIDSLADMLNASGDFEGFQALTKAFANNHTVGDMMHNMFIMNLLSAGTTHAINFLSNNIRVAVLNPVGEFWAAGGRAAHGDLDGFREAIDYTTATFAGYKSAVVVPGAYTRARVSGKGVVRAAQMATEGNRVGKAFTSARRQTAGAGIKFVDDGLGKKGLLRSQAVGNLVKRGAPVHVPFSGWIGKGTQINSLGFVPQKGLDTMGNYISRRKGIFARGLDYFGKTMELPAKLLAASDEFAASAAYGAQAAKGARRAAMAEGLDADATLARIKQIERDIPRRDALAAVASPIDSDQANYVKLLDRLHEESSTNVAKATFTEPSQGLADAITKAQGKVPSLRWFIPFIRTPANLIKSGVMDFTPVGAFLDLQTAVKAGDATAKQEALGRIALTGSYVFGAYKAVENGQITGGGPTNFRKRERWLAAGNKPYAFTLPDGSTLQYNRYDPMALPIAMIADSMEVMGNMDELAHDEIIGEIAGRISENFKSRSYMEGVSHLMDFFNNPAGTNSARIMASTAANMIPGSRLWASIERGGLPLPDDMIVAAGDPNAPPALRWLDELIEGDDTRDNVQRTGGNSFGENVVIEFGSTVQANLPAGISDGWTALFQKVMNAKLADGETDSLGYFAEPVDLPVTYGPNVVSAFVGSERGDDDPLNKELSRIGFGVSIRQQFSQIRIGDASIKLLPKQQEFFQKAFAEPGHGKLSLREKYTRKIFKSNGDFTSWWVRKNESFEGDTQSEKVMELNKIEGRYMDKAKKALRKRFPDVDAKMTLAEEEDGLRTKTGGIEELERRKEAGSLLNQRLNGE
jgi:hypothetical protein